MCITLWSRVPLTKFGSHRTFLLEIGLWLTFTWSLTPQMYNTLVKDSSDQIDSQSTFLGKFTFVWTLHDLWSHQCIIYTLSKGSFHQLLTIIINILGLIVIGAGAGAGAGAGEGVIRNPRRQVCSHRASQSDLTPGWPLRNLWAHEYILLWSKVLLTKFFSHKTFLGKALTLGALCFEFLCVVDLKDRLSNF